MPIRVECPCGWADQVKAAFAGQEIRCGDCGKRLTVPDEMEIEDVELIDEGVEEVDDLDAVEILDEGDEMDVVEIVVEKPAKKANRRPAFKDDDGIEVLEDNVDIIEDDEDDVDVVVDDEEDAPTPARRRGAGAGRAPAGKGGSTLLVALLLIVIVGGGGGATAWYLMQEPTKPVDIGQAPGPGPDPGPGPGPMPMPMPIPMPPMVEPEPKGPWKGHLSPIVTLRVTPEGREVLTAAGGTTQRDGKTVLARDNTLRSFQTGSGDMQMRHDVKGGVAVAAFSADGNWAAIVPLGRVEGENFEAGADKDIVVWDLKTWKEAARLKGHEKPALCLAFSADGTRLISGGPDGIVRLWELPAGKALQQFGGHTAPVHAVAFSPDGLRAVSGSGDHTVRVWDLSAKGESVTLGQHQDIVHTVCFLPDSKRVLSGGGGEYRMGEPGYAPGQRDHDIRLWDVAEKKELGRFKGHGDRVLALAVDTAGRRFLSSSEDRTARLWQIETQTTLHTFSEHNAPVLAVGFLPGNRGVSAGEDKEPRLFPFPVDIGELVAQLKQPNKLEAIAALRKLGAEARPALPELIQVYKAGDEPTRTEVLAALKQMGPLGAGAGAILAPLLEVNVREGRLFVLQALRDQPDEAKPLTDGVLNCLKDKDSAVRLDALLVVAGLGREAGEKSLPLVIDRLDDSDSKVVEEARKTLPKLGPASKAHVPVLRQALKSLSRETRQFALTSLGVLGPNADAAAEDLRGLLEKEANLELRRLALETLLKIDASSRITRETLVRALQDLDQQVVSLALTSLTQDDVDVKLYDELLKSLDHENPAIRQQIQAVLTQKTRKVHIDLLVKVLDGKKRDSQKVVLGLLKSLKTDAAPSVKALVKLLQATEPEAKALRKPALEVVKALGQTANDEALRKQLAALASEDDTLLFDVTEILIELTAIEGKPLIERVVKKMLGVEGKEQAVALMRKLGPEAALPLAEALNKSFGGPGPERAIVQIETIRLIQDLGNKKRLPTLSAVLAELAKLENLTRVPEVKTAAAEARLSLQKAPQ